jgi:hypothetical protein
VGIEEKAFRLFLFVADGEESLFVPVSSWPPGRTIERFDVSLTYIPGSTAFYGGVFRMLSDTISFANHLA